MCDCLPINIKIINTPFCNPPLSLSICLSIVTFYFYGKSQTAPSLPTVVAPWWKKAVHQPPGPPTTVTLKSWDGKKLWVWGFVTPKLCALVSVLLPVSCTKLASPPPLLTIKVPGSYLGGDSSPQGIVGNIRIHFHSPNGGISYSYPINGGQGATHSRMSRLRDLGQVDDTIILPD